jgi:hypothetical protein
VDIKGDGAGSGGSYFQMTLLLENKMEDHYKPRLKYA